jgi:hypothetical protein
MEQEAQENSTRVCHSFSEQRYTVTFKIDPGTGELFNTGHK